MGTGKPGPYGYGPAPSGGWDVYGLDGRQVVRHYDGPDAEIQADAASAGLLAVYGILLSRTPPRPASPPPIAPATTPPAASPTRAPTPTTASPAPTPAHAATFVNPAFVAYVGAGLPPGGVAPPTAPPTPVPPAPRPTPQGPAPSPFPGIGPGSPSFAVAVPTAATQTHTAFSPRGALAGFPSLLPRQAAVAAGVGIALLDLPREMERFAEGVHAANRALAPFTPGLARAEALLHLSDFRRTIGLARATEPSAVELTRAVDAMRDALYPFRVAGGHLRNEAGGFAAGLVGGLGQAGGGWAVLLENGLKKLDDKAGGDFAAKMGDALGKAIIYGNPILGPLTLAVNKLNDAMGWVIEKPKLESDPWTAMMFDQAGARRVAPLHGGPRFNPAERLP